MSRGNNPDVTLPRDRAALSVIGRFRMMTRVQIHGFAFPGRAENVVKRFVDRLTARGFLGAARLHGSGAQLLWCTPAGRDHLVETGVGAAEMFFPARGPVAAKDLAHTLAIGDAALSCLRRGQAGDEMIPAWMLQRMVAGRLSVIPDLLCLTRPRLGARGAVLAVEVDLGGEGVRSVFLPKLAELAHALPTISPAAAVAILVLTSAVRRRDALLRGLALAKLRLPVAVELLTTFALSPNVRTECVVEDTPCDV